MWCGRGRSKTLDDDEGPYSKTEIGKHGSKRPKKKNKSSLPAYLAEKEETIVSDLTVTNEMLYKANNEQRKKNETLECDVENLRDELGYYKGEFTNLKRSTTSLKENVRALDVTVLNLKIRNTDLVMEVECTQRRLSETEGAEIRLQMDLAKVAKLNVDLQDDNSSLRRDKDALAERANQFTSLEKTKEALETSLVEKTRRILDLERLLYCLNRSISEDLTQLRSLSESAISKKLDTSRSIKEGVDKIQDTLEKQHKTFMMGLDCMTEAWSHFLEMDIGFDTLKFPSNSMRIPAILRGAAERLSCNLGPNWVEAGRLLNLSGEDLERISVDWSKYGMKELAFRVIEHWCSTMADDASLEGLQTALREMERNPLELDPMPEDHIATLQENSPQLIEEMMDVSLVEPHLRQNHVISRSACEYVIDPPTRHGRIRRLLKVLAFCGARALPVFRDALIKSGQGHLAQKLIGTSLPAEPAMEETGGCRLDESGTHELVTKQFEKKITNLQEKADNDDELNRLTFRCAMETKCEVLKVREKIEKFEIDMGDRIKKKTRKSSEGSITLNTMPAARLLGTKTL